ncbi:MAG TPA: VOC family protein [Gemmatimonadaceae bacterium]|nr:VOC family protein [Gemmatimonadaceae bacterium]
MKNAGESGAATAPVETVHGAPESARVGGVRLQVSDLERSLAFYQDVLGLHLLGRDGESASLGAQGGDEVLVQLVARRGARPVPRGGRLGLYHFALLLPDRADLGRFLSSLRAHGVAAGAADHAVSEAVYLHDPDNLGIEVYADRPRSAWERRNGELVMTTEPLDVRDLFAAAGNSPWTGAPEGSRIGHVHLSVGDLARADAFYHGALGLERTVWSYPGALFFAAGGYHHHVGTNVWAAHAGAPEADEAQLLEWELLPPTDAAVRDATARLEQGGYDAQRDARGGVVARDPWGTAVRVRAERAPAR